MKKLSCLLAFVALAASAQAKETDRTRTNTPADVRSLNGKWCTGYNPEIQGVVELNITYVQVRDQYFNGTYEYLGNVFREGAGAYKNNRVEGDINAKGYIRFASNDRVSYSLLYLGEEVKLLYGFGKNSKTNVTFRVLMVKDQDVCDAGRKEYEGPPPL